jgi:hypothetical protein
MVITVKSRRNWRLMFATGASDVRIPLPHILCDISHKFLVSRHIESGAYINPKVQW